MKKGVVTKLWTTFEEATYDPDVRDLLTNRGIKPEELTPEEDVHKMKRRITKDEKQIVDGLKESNE